MDEKKLVKNGTRHGGRGAPIGNKNQSKPKIWSDALRKAIMCRDEGGKRALDRLAKVLVKAAEDGDVAAIKEIGDRLEGKVASSDVRIDLSVDLGAALAEARARAMRPPIELEPGIVYIPDE